MIVACDICGHHHDQASPDVRYLPVDAVWICEDETACFNRRPPHVAPWILGTRQSPCCGITGRTT